MSVVYISPGDRAVVRRIASGSWYSGYDCLPVDGTPAMRAADAVQYEVPAVRCDSGLRLPALPLVPPAPDLRADLESAQARAAARGSLHEALDALIDTNLRSNT